MINPEVNKIVDNYGFNRDNILTYLLSLYYGLKPDFIPEEVKKQTYITGIINRDFDKGTVKWTVPLFPERESKQQTIQDSNWEWVDSEYRQLFRNIDKTKGGDKKSCLRKMKKYFAEHPEVRKDDVIEATKLYLEQFLSGKENPKFLQQANYFIFKAAAGGDGYQSRLSQYLELVKENQNISGKKPRGLL